MARTVIRERQVLDSDFASEEELEARILVHEENTLHVPEALSPDNDNQYLKFDGTNYVWSSQIPIPNPNNDDQKILRYDAASDSIVWINQADIQTIALPYYWDEDRQKYLDNQIIRVMFSRSGTNRTNTYMRYADGISSSKFPYELRTGEDSCLVSFEYSTTDKNSGKVIEVRDINDNKKVLATLNLGSTDVDYAYSENLNIDFAAGVAISAYIKSTSLDNAVFVLGFRKIYNPE
jgi:hypothetical protein